MSLEDAINRLAAAIEKSGVSAPAVTNVAGPAQSAPKATKAAKPVPATVAEPTVAAVSKEDVGNAVVGLIQANQREAAVKLLASYGAKAVSEVKEADYAALLAKANDILATA